MTVAGEGIGPTTRVKDTHPVSLHAPNSWPSILRFYDPPLNVKLRIGQRPDPDASVFTGWAALPEQLLESCFVVVSSLSQLVERVVRP
jgi:hypothetical protein